MIKVPIPPMNVVRNITSENKLSTNLLKLENSEFEFKELFSRSPTKKRIKPVTKSSGQI